MPEQPPNPPEKQNTAIHKEGDVEAGFEILDNFQRFHQKDEMLKTQSSCLPSWIIYSWL